MNVQFTVSRHRLPLRAPYALSFGTLTHFDTFYLRLEAGGNVGMGEITPLPGYGHETVETVAEELKSFALLLDTGCSYMEAAAQVHTRAPMTGSGLVCAYETRVEGSEEALKAGLPSPLPLAAFCPGDTVEEMTTTARSLVAKGFTALKLKVGRMKAEEEAALVHAACNQLPEGGSVRMDANQRSEPEHAAKLCELLAGLPVSHFEQPFAPDAWEAHKDLAKLSPVPILLDESIESLPDIRRAADIGVKAVKLKLCKHLGMAETHEMITTAQALGMKIIFGNGVQSALGNHLEARLAEATGINTALELNGFAKVAQSPFDHAMRVERGNLIDEGLGENISGEFHNDRLMDKQFDSRQLEENLRGI